MKKLALLVASIACCASAQTPASAPSTCPTMEVGIVAEKSGDSARNISSVNGELISLTKAPLLTIDNFTDANVSLTEGQIVLNVNMTPESAKRVRAFTASHVGKKMAFVVNGRVINTPQFLIRSPGRAFSSAPFVEMRRRD